MKIHIYILKHPDTNEIRYVGQTNDIKRRLDRHIQNSRNKDYAKKLLDESKDYENMREILTQNL